jgi:hypothetical protein
MSDDVIVGFHGRPRCTWAGAADTAFGRYHDGVGVVNDHLHGCFRATDYDGKASGRL